MKHSEIVFVPFPPSLSCPPSDLREGQEGDLWQGGLCFLSGRDLPVCRDVFSHVCFRGFEIIRPFDEAYAVFPAAFLLGQIQFPAHFQCFLSAEEIDGLIMLDPLILHRGSDFRNVEIQALPSEPVRTVLVEGSRIALFDRAEEGELVLPLGLDDSLIGQAGTDLRALETPVCLPSVFFLVECDIRIPPLKKRHDQLTEVSEEFQLALKVALLDDVIDVPSHIDGLDWMMMKGQISLIPGQRVREIGVSQNDSILLEVIQVPGEGVVVQSVAAKQILRAAIVEKVIHQKNTVHIFLVKDGEIVDCALIWKEVPDRMKDFRSSADLRHDEKLGDETLRKEKAGLFVCVEIPELGHEGLDQDS